MTITDAVSNRDAPFKAVMLPGWEAMNEHLRDILLTMAGCIPDKVSHMPSGRSFFDNKWLSSNRLHQEGDPIFRELGAAIVDIADHLPWPGNRAKPLRITSMWGIVSRSGMEGRRHSHKGAISVAYYVAAGMSSESAGGQLRFHTDGLSPAHAVTPRDGLLVLFPSSLQHSVSHYASDDRRIVISANLS